MLLCKLSVKDVYFENDFDNDYKVIELAYNNLKICSRTAGASIIGRRAKSKQIDARTSEQHVCNACCKRDLCNKNCRVAHNESDNSGRSYMHFHLLYNLYRLCLRMLLYNLTTINRLSTHKYVNYKKVS
jgi:hypothetical protein